MEYHPVMDNYPTILALLLGPITFLALGLFIASLWKILVKLIKKERTGLKGLVIAAVVSPVICVLSFHYHPGATTARHQGRAAMCIGNLIRIEKAKQKWAAENGATGGDEITGEWETLERYFKQDTFAKDWPNLRPRCPSGGTYSIGRVGEDPRCSIEENRDVNYSWDDHTLAARRGESKKPKWRH